MSPAGLVIFRRADHVTYVGQLFELRLFVDERQRQHWEHDSNFKARYQARGALMPQTARCTWSSPFRNSSRKISSFWPSIAGRSVPEVPALLTSRHVTVVSDHLVPFQLNPLKPMPQSRHALRFRRSSMTRTLRPEGLSGRFEY